MILYCRSHLVVFMYIGYLNTTRLCWLNKERESSHIGITYIFWYLDDILIIDNPEFENHISESRVTQKRNSFLRFTFVRCHLIFCDIIFCFILTFYDFSALDGFWSVVSILSKNSWKFRGIFKMKSRVKTRHVREIWSKLLENRQVSKMGTEPVVRKGKCS